MSDIDIYLEDIYQCKKKIDCIIPCNNYDDSLINKYDKRLITMCLEYCHENFGEFCKWVEDKRKWERK